MIPAPHKKTPGPSYSRFSRKTIIYTTSGVFIKSCVGRYLLVGWDEGGFPHMNNLKVTPALYCGRAPVLKPRAWWHAPVGSA